MNVPVTAFAACFALGAALLAAGCASPVLPEQYREPFASSWPIRERQHRQMKAYLDSFPRREGPEDATFTLDFSNVAAYERSIARVRAASLAQAGLPPHKAVENPEPRIEFVAGDRVADIYRVWTEVFEGVEAYGIYMVPRDLKGKAPVLMAVHGGSGCPEAICDLDTRVNYKAFGREACKRGYIVYAPGVLMQVSYAQPRDPLIEGAGWKDLREQAGELGTSTYHLQVYQMMVAVKALAKVRPEADGERIGMTGLSMGAGYTLATMAASPDIKVAVASAGFAQRRDAPPPPPDIDTLTIGPDMPRTDIVALCCPRPLMIQSGRADGVVSYERASLAVPRARSYYEKLGIADRFEFDVHEGGHVFENEAIFRFFDKHLRGEQGG